jgi:hypothetical protein
VRVPVKLVEKASGQFVDAELFDEVTEEHLLLAEEQWRPMIREARRKLPPELRPRNAHWDWTSKDRELALLANTFYAIQLADKIEGLMKVETVGHVCRLPEQSRKELVYIDYVETAPWNIKVLMNALGEQPKYALVGTRLIEAAVHQSFEEGFKGRVGLHAVPTSHDFYIKVCGMTPVAPDPNKENLLSCEFTPEQAAKL